MSQSCRSCAHLAVKPDASGRQVARKSHAYRCDYPLPSMPPMPDSLTLRRWRPPSDQDKGMMEPDDGRTCPVYSKREPANVSA